MSISLHPRGLIGVVGALSLVVGTSRAQTPIPDRMLGQEVATSDLSFPSVTGLRELSDGRVLVLGNGPLVILDAQLAHAERVADSASGVGQLGLKRPTLLIAGRADTTLVVDEAIPQGLVVLEPTGRAVALRPYWQGTPISPIALRSGTAVIDPDGRLVYQSFPLNNVGPPILGGMAIVNPDTNPIVRFDFTTGHLDAITYVQVSRDDLHRVRDTATGAVLTTYRTRPFPAIDDWVMTSDGTLAVIRGADLHIDWILPTGAIRSTPPLPCPRRPVTPGDTLQFVTDMKAQDQQRNEASIKRGAGPGGQPPMEGRTQIKGPWPAYFPPFTARGALAASDGTIWLPAAIRTPGTTGYDVIDSKGHLVERVHLPVGATLVGFGKGVVYVLDGGHHVERLPLH